MPQRRSTIWVDAGGRTRIHLLTSSAGATAVEAAIAAKSNAAVQLSWEGPLVVTATPVPVAAVYPAVDDIAVLLYQTGSGALQKVIIPAPLASIFHADQETVDPAQITALTTAVLADLVTPAGVALTAYVSGTRGHQR